MKGFTIGCTLLLFLGTNSVLFGNNISVANLTYNELDGTLVFDLSWDNAFREGGLTYMDFAHVFIKYKNGNGTTWEHMPIPLTGHTTNSSSVTIGRNIISGGMPNNERATLRTFFNGFFNSGSVDIECTIKLSTYVTLINPSFKVFAIEMVSSGKDGSTANYLGDGTSSNRFHKGNDVNQAFLYGGALNVGSVNVGNGSDQINVLGTPLPVSVIPLSYFAYGFMSMKYEITQEQYLDFLNCLNRTAQNEHTETDISGTFVANQFVMSGATTPNGRNGIKCDAVLPNGGPIVFYSDLNNNGIKNETKDGQNIAANYLLPKDFLAYLDWAGMQPMNEIDYEFLCRGPQQAIPGEYAWGSDIKTAVILSIGAGGGPDETPTNVGADGLFRRSSSPMRVGANATANTNRIQSGASISGAMNLSGNLAELVIGSYSANDFVNPQKSDGTISAIGLHNNPSWPSNLTIKGLASSNSSLNSVSHRYTAATAYVSNTVRSASIGGRGIMRN